MESVKIAMVLHYTHTLLNAVSVGDMVMVGSCTISWNFPNNCDVLSGSDLPHKSHLLPTECPCVYESDCSVHNTTECTLPHLH